MWDTLLWWLPIARKQLCMTFIDMMESVLKEVPNDLSHMACDDKHDKWLQYHDKGVI